MPEPLKDEILTRPLNESLSEEEIKAITDPEALKALIISFKGEIYDLERDIEGHVRIEKGLRTEIARLTNELAGVRKANANLNARVYGPQPIEVPR